MPISAVKVARFQRRVWRHYRYEGRELPWRGEKDPYRVLVSEVMLQQTQVRRVVPKYRAFLKRFPTVGALARVPLRDVLAVWQGLGYNRRAKMLHACAKTVVREHGGKVPRASGDLRALPGVGTYTDAAVRVFAYREPAVVLETNTRTAYIHHFFPHGRRVADTELVPIAEACLDRKRVDEWHHALMDYGAMLKRTEGNAARKSAHYYKQSRFEGSTRQLRGAIIRLLVVEEGLSPRAIAARTKHNTREVRVQLERLSDEGLVMRRGRMCTLV